MGQTEFRRAEGGCTLRWRRAAWLASTGLSALLLNPGALHAQSALAPDTTPQGGVVVGGGSSIAQATGSTVITQTSQRTAIDWQSFNVGSAATVQFVQPNASAIALNRVVTPEPSLIAGKINANGQLVLINQSGVVFAGGAQVNAESIVVSTSNIANKDFMAGHLVFSGAPNPGAKIINNGQLTAGEAGLVGLVAPQVANNGVITARLGQVVLAGAAAFTLDLYGDRLISLDVTQAVRAVDVGGKLVPALVTNRGLILADGGKITLTAQDADALVTQLIDAGGTIRANSVGNETGTISLQGVGGNINIAGNLLAQGNAAGTKGGAIEAVTDGTVNIAPGAVIDASGAAGGGVVALGTDLARAGQGAADTTAPRAAMVEVAKTASVKADATENGDGGTVTLLSSERTDFAGSISTQGGPQGGNGGLVEISSTGVISLSGTVFDTAIDGKAGEILLDPATLVVGTGSPSASVSGATTFGGFTGTDTSFIDPGILDLLSGNIVLEAGKLIAVEQPLDLSDAATGLTLISRQDVTIASASAISLFGSLEIDATGSIVIGSSLAAANISLLNTGSGAIDLNALVSAGTLVALASGGGITESAGGIISAPSLVSIGTNSGDDVLGQGNSIAQLGSFTDTAAGFTLTDTGLLQVAGPVSAQGAVLSAGTLAFSGDVSAANALVLAANAGGVSQSAGTLSAGTLATAGTIGGGVALGDGNSIATLGVFAAIGTILLDNATALKIAGRLDAPAGLTLEDGGAITEIAGGTIATPTLTTGGTAIGGDVSLANGNSIATLGSFTVSGTHGLVLADTQSLDVAGTLLAGAAALSAPAITISAPLTLTGALGLDGTAGGVSQTAAGIISAGTLTSGGATIAGTASLADANTIGTLGAFAATGDILLNNNGALNIAGLVHTPGILTVEDTGAITEVTGGAITAATLTSGTAIGGNVSLANANSIATLGSFDVGTNSFSLGDTGSLNVAGTLTAAAATLNAATLGLAAPITVTGELALEGGAGGVTEHTGGTISAGTLSSGGTTIGGTVSLGNVNNFGTLGDFAATGNILLQDTVALDISGLVGTPHQLTLEAGGALTEIAGGTLSLGTLTTGATTIGGAVSLGNINTIATLGIFAAAGDILLDNSGGLNLAGLVTAPGTLTLEGSGAFTEIAGGTISAPTLTSGGTTLAGNVSLGNANSIATLADFTVGTLNAFALTTAGSLNVAGTLIAGSATLDAPTLSLAAPLSITNVLALEAGAGGVTEATGGIIAAGTLTSGGTTIASAVALANANTIATLGGFAATGDILLNNTGPLNISGLVATPGMLTLEDTGAITELAGGVLSAASLTSGGTSIGGDVLLTNSNSVATLASFDVGTHTFALIDDGTLTVAGSLTAASATLGGASLDLATAISVTGILALEAGSGGVGEATGITFSAGTLSSGGTTIGGAVALGNANNFATLAGFAAAGNILLNDISALNIIGLVHTPGELTLIDGGAVGEGPGGTLALGTLTSGTAALGGAVSLGNANLIGTLGPFAATGDILLGTTGGMNIAGLVTTSGVLTLQGGPVSEVSGGTIAVTTLTTGATTLAGAASLTNANLIGTLGAFAATGNIWLNNANALDIAGLLDTQAQLTLQDAGAITELAGGTITAGTLASGGAIGGAVSLGNANTIATLGNFTVSGAPLALNDTGSLLVSGQVSAPTATLSAGSIAISGLISASAALALQTSNGGIAESTGTIIAGTLSAPTISGNAVLTGANTIAQLGSFTASGNLSLANNGALDIAAPVRAANISLADHGTLTLGAGVTATFGHAALAVDGLLAGGGNVTAPGGTITITPFTGGLAVDLGGTSITGLQLSNLLIGELDPTATVSITTTGSVRTEGAVSFANPALDLAASGLVTQTGSLTGQRIDLTGASLALDGVLTATALNLASPGGVTEPGTGILSIGTLASTGTIGGAVALGGTANAIATLAAFAGAQNLTLEDSGALTLTGPVLAQNIALTATGGIAIDGLVSAATAGTISLVADRMSANGASLSAAGGTLLIAPFTAGTPVDLGGTLAGLDLSAALLAAAGNAALLDIHTTGSIIGQGAVTVTSSTLALNGNFIGLRGALDVPGVLILASSNGVTSTAGEVLTATSLTGSSIGPVNLAAGTNHITTLGTFTLAGANNDFALTNAGTLDVAAPLTARNIALGAAGLTLASALDASGGVTLASSNGITESGAGVINAPTLASNGQVTGPVALGGANSIGALNGFLDSGNFVLNDITALNVTGNVSAANITLAAAGIGLSGSLNTGTLALASSAGITQPSGTLSATLLTSDGGTIGGAADFAAAGNNIQTLGPFAASGNVDLQDGAPLTVHGPVNAANVTLGGDGIALDGAVTTGTLQLASGAGVTEGAAGLLNAALLTTGNGSVAGDTVLGNANQITALGNFTATGGLSLNDAQALAISGPVTLGGGLTLTDPLSVTQTGGSIAAAALTGSIGGNALLTATANAILVLQNFSAGGNFSLGDGVALNLAGNISAGNALSLDTGAITQGSGIVSTPMLNAIAPSISLPDANQIADLGAVTATGDVAVAGVSNIAGPLSAANASISSPGNLVLSGNAQVTGTFAATSPDNFNQNGSLNAGDAVISAAEITLSGATAITSELDLITAGNITHASGVLDAGTLAGSAGQLASFTGPTDIATIGSFIMQDSTFALTNSGDLTLVGPLVAGVVRISAVGTFTLAGSVNGGLFIKGRIAPDKTITPLPVDSVITVTAPNGALPAIVQTGSFLINSGPNALNYLPTTDQVATLFLNTLPSGTMSFAAYPAGVMAPSLDLILAAGPLGVASGNLDLRHLEVQSALSTNLTGTINGVTGPTAAGNGSVTPFPQPNFRFNACPIGSVNCTILPIESVPAGNPLESFDVSSRKRKRLGHNVALPGVASRDF